MAEQSISEGSSGVILQRLTYIASSKFFSAMALLPRALSSSAEAIVKAFDSGEIKRGR